MNYAYDKLRLEENYDEVSKEEEEGIKFLQMLKIVCQGCGPILSVEARHMLMRYYADVVYPKDSPFSRRLLESLKNTCYAIAKVNLKNIIDEYDAKEAIEFFKVHISQHLSAVVNVPNNPARVGAEKIIDKLRTCLNSKYEWIELLDAVCKEDQYVSEYIGFNKESQRDWSTKSNRKVRKIKELMRLLPSYKDKILLFTMVPLRLAWKETYTGGDKDAAIDIDSRMCRDGCIHEDVEEEVAKSSSISQSDDKEHVTSDNPGIEGSGSDKANPSNVNLKSRAAYLLVIDQ